MYPHPSASTPNLEPPRFTRLEAGSYGNNRRCCSSGTLQRMQGNSKAAGCGCGAMHVLVFGNTDRYGANQAATIRPAFRRKRKTLYKPCDRRLFLRLVYLFFACQTRFTHGNFVTIRSDSLKEPIRLKPCAGLSLLGVGLDRKRVVNSGPYQQHQAPKTTNS